MSNLSSLTVFFEYVLKMEAKQVITILFSSIKGLKKLKFLTLNIPTKSKLEKDRFNKIIKDATKNQNLEKLEFKLTFTSL